MSNTTDRDTADRDGGDRYDIWGRELRRGPEAVGALLDGLLAKVTTPGGRVMVELAGHWEQIAGRPWAGVSRPVGLRSGVLLIEVADGGAATVLRFQQGALQQRLNRRFGDDTVVDVKLRVRRGRLGGAPAAGGVPDGSREG